MDAERSQCDKMRGKESQNQRGERIKVSREKLKGGNRLEIGVLENWRILQDIKMKKGR